MPTTSFFNRGIYSAPEAARILQVKTAWVYRLIRGYTFKTRSGAPSSSPKLFEAELGEVRGLFTVTFLDLIELMFVRDFLKQGVSLHTIRKAAVAAAELYSEEQHPFCVQQFQTDGKRIFARAASEVGDDKMVELVKRQHVFTRVVAPYLKQLEYSTAGTLQRWFPLGTNRHVVLDPAIRFGAPVVKDVAVPVHSLAAGVRGGETHAAVARWYDVPVGAVRDAVAFEKRLAA